MNLSVRYLYWVVLSFYSPPSILAVFPKDNLVSLRASLNAMKDEFVLRPKPLATTNQFSELRDFVLHFQGVFRSFKQALLSIQSDFGAHQNYSMAIQAADNAKLLFSSLLAAIDKQEPVLRFSSDNSLVSLVNNALHFFDFEPVTTVSCPDLRGLEVDRYAIGIVIRNLVQNALQAGATNIHIEGGELPDGCFIRFIDNGPGISLQVFGNILEAGVSTKKGPSNMGQGLAQCARYVSQHNGTMSYWNNSDRQEGANGATFEIVLPMKHSSLS